MKLTWMKDIVGDTYTEEMDAAACQAIGKNFASRADFNAKSQALQEKETELAALRASAQAAQGLQAELDSLKAQYAKDTGEWKLGRQVDKALMDAKARNLELARKALDLSKAGGAEKERRVSVCGGASGRQALEHRRQPRGRPQGLHPGTAGGHVAGGDQSKLGGRCGRPQPFGFPVEPDLTGRGIASRPQKG